LLDGAIKEPGAMASDSGTAWMGIEHDSITRRKHTDGVGSERGQRMGHRRHGTDNAEGRILGQRQSVLARHGIGAKNFDARDAVADDFELLDLVQKSADPGFLKLHLPQRLGLRDTDSPDALDRFAPFIEPASLKFALSTQRSGHGGANIAEQSVL